MPAHHDDLRRDVQRSSAPQEKELVNRLTGDTYGLTPQDWQLSRNAADAGLPLFELMDRVQDAWDSGVGFIKKELGGKAKAPTHNLPNLTITD